MNIIKVSFLMLFLIVLVPVIAEQKESEALNKPVMAQDKQSQAALSSTDFQFRYSKAYAASIKGHNNEAIKLLIEINTDLGPHPFSNLLLAHLLYKKGQYIDTIKYLNLIPEAQQGIPHWAILMASYKAIKGKGFNKYSINLTVEKFIAHQSFYPDGAADNVFNYLDMFPNPKAKAIFCQHRLIINHDRCL